MKLDWYTQILAVFILCTNGALHALTLDDPDYTFIRLSRANWDSSIVTNLYSFPNSRLLDDAPFGTTYFPSTGSGKVRGKRLDYGASFAAGQVSRGKVGISFLVANTPTKSLPVYVQDNYTSFGILSVNTVTTGLDSYAGGKAHRYTFYYDHEFFLAQLVNSTKPSNYFLNLGLKVGIDTEFDDAKIRDTLVARVVGTSRINGFGTNTVSPINSLGLGFAESKNSTNTQGYTIGLSYRTPVAKHLFADVSATYRKATGEGKVEQKGLLISSPTLASPTEVKAKYNLATTGPKFDAGLAYYFTDSFSLRFGLSSQVQHQTIIKLKTNDLSGLLNAAFSNNQQTIAAATILTIIPDLGPIPSHVDRMKTVSVEAQIHF